MLNRFSFLVDPYTYYYFQSHWTDGYTDTITAYDGIHTTDVTQEKALAVLDDAAATGEQFFMMVTPGESYPRKQAYQSGCCWTNLVQLHLMPKS